VRRDAMSGARGPASDAVSASVPPFQSFLDEHRSLVYRFLLATVGPSEADDCFQETFLAALRAYPRLRSGENLRAWILTIATRKAIDATRARARRPVPDGETVRERADRDGAVEAPHASDPRDPLWRAVRRLPVRQRAAVVHRHVLDRSYAEIAHAMRCSEQTARANVSHGMRALRSMLETS
jgi:RNA polymerase sigma factor (sigma-70 family)